MSHWTRRLSFVLLSALGVTALAPVAHAQLARAEHQYTITLDRVEQMHVTSLGRILAGATPPATPAPGGYQPRLCDQIATHTGASFTGGTYTLQGGMGEGEMFAQTYTVPANEWPIKIVRTECIFGTQNASVATVTEWSVLFYQGVPSATNPPVATFSSDDVILPHIRMNPGTNGVNVQFSIDPTDPEQLFIQNNGTNQFTVAYRIDNHNNQTANPCSTPPPSNSNAFIATDNTQSPAPCNQYPELQQPTLNWLFGLNCGGSGCPSNGGWARFSALQGDFQFGSSCFPGCRPHGDVVMRAVWSGVNCQPGVGACCMPDGQCAQMTVSDCGTAGGSYAGDGISCASANCPQPQGACCFNTGFCSVIGQQDCVGAGGTFAGVGTQCAGPNQNQCPLGACCLQDGACATGFTQQTCSAQGGTFRGTGSNCDQPCPAPTGACCMPNGFCFQTQQSSCSGAGGTFYGAGVQCHNGNACPTGACCLPDGQCVNGVSAASCANQGGNYQGNGTSCGTTNCPQPNGACCAPNGFCFVTSNATCAGAGGSWSGPNTTCVDNNGNSQPDACEQTSNCGPQDFNGDGDSGTDQDIEAFFACLGGTCCDTCYAGGADFNGDGDTGTDQDIEAFFRVLGGNPC
ncbi:MAG TPA: hypothetical protein VD997_07360 [Phycisphaerales bacterium]|nr:hypothetical protein [Phycisphaerales bacterium]